MSKKAIIFHVFAAILVLVFFIVSRMPAYIAFNQLKSSPAGQYVRFGDVGGTLWQGTVSGLAIRYNTMNVVLGYTRWQVNPWALLSGSMALHLRAENGKQMIDGDVRVGLDRTVRLSEAEIMAPASMVSQFYPIPGLVEGQFELSVSELALKVEGIQALEATGVYRDARYTLAEPLDLGTYAARFSKEKDVLKADISDLDAHIGMDGVATFNPITREYDLDVKLLPKATANPVIAQGLSQFFPQTPEGSYHVRQRGNI